MSLLTHYQGYTLTADQAAAATAIESFLAEELGQVFILHGYAGTGKSFLMQGVVEYLKANQRHVLGAAPTGRAARVLTVKGKIAATTIHKLIYKPQPPELEAEQYSLQFDLAESDKLPASTVLIVDEASMISDNDSSPESISFGSGRLLFDLIQFMSLEYNPQRRILFVGDSAQLPPIGSDTSVALQAEMLRDLFNLRVQETQLKEVVRQAKGSGIYVASIRIRELLFDGQAQTPMPPVPHNVSYVPRFDLIDKYFTINGTLKPEPDAIVIALSNKQVKRYNTQIRNAIFPPSANTQPLVGDLLVVNANNYLAQSTLMNGEFLSVVAAREQTETIEVTIKISPRYQRFCKDSQYVKKIQGSHVTEAIVTLKFRELIVKRVNENEPFAIKILDNLLWVDTADVSRWEIQALYTDFLYRVQEEIKRKEVKDKKSMSKKEKHDFVQKSMQADHYFNAVRCKFGYAVTCHKAQGGEWPKVFVDSFRRPIESASEKNRWLYTAITRASANLYITK